MKIMRVLLFVMITSCTLAQKAILKGKINTESGPLSFATIQLEGLETVGTNSNEDGT